jgi:hypothetical protein
VVYDLVPWECCLNKGSVVCKGLEGRGVLYWHLKATQVLILTFMCTLTKGGHVLKPYVRGLNVQNVVRLSYHDVSGG